MTRASIIGALHFGQDGRASNVIKLGVNFALDTGDIQPPSCQAGAQLSLSHRRLAQRPLPVMTQLNTSGVGESSAQHNEIGP